MAQSPYLGWRTSVPRLKPRERVPPLGLRIPLFAGCNGCNWRRMSRVPTRYHNLLHVGFSAPLTDAAMTQASTAWEPKDCFDLLLAFWMPYCSRSALVCYPWHKSPVE